MKTQGPISYMASHKVAANLLMLIFILGGLFMSFKIKQEVFPEYELDIITINMSYPGASPNEVEKSIILPIEEALNGLDGINKISSIASESLAEVTLELEPKINKDRVLQSVKQAIDAIKTFPIDAEKPRISISSTKRVNLSIIIYADIDELALREYAESLRDRLLMHKSITQVELGGIKKREIKIELNKEKLQQYNLSLPELSNIISKYSLELSGGTIKSQGGEILIRLNEKRELAKEFKEIPILTSNSGNRLYLKDIATITEGFKDIDSSLSFNGKRAISLNIYKSANQTPIEVSDAALSVLNEFKKEIPSNIGLEVVDNRADVYKARLELLLKNAFFGLILVFITLGLFLEFKLAFWVAMGIPTSFIGTILFLPFFDVSINMVSLFAFIIALGIVVDDAIIVGENIYEYRQKGLSYLQAAIKGAQDIAIPVAFAIITNIIAFLPLLFVPGFIGRTFEVIPMVVATAFIISWIEALFILPNHLSHDPKTSKNPILSAINRNQQKVANALVWFVEHVFRPSLIFSVKHRYIIVSFAFAILFVMVAYAQSGRLGFSLMPVVESDKAVATIKLPFGATFNEAKAIEAKLIQSGLKTVDEVNPNISKGYRASISENLITIEFFLLPLNERNISTAEFIRFWRKNTKEIAGVESMQFKSDIGGLGGGRAALSIRLSHNDSKLLEQAALELSKELKEIKSTKDVTDGVNRGKQELVITLLPKATILGLTSEDIAKQVRSAYYGIESIRQLRGRDEITVRISLQNNQKDELLELYSLMIKSPNGGYVPLREVANISFSQAPTSIIRENRKRVLTVEANIEPISDLTMVTQRLESDVFVELKNKYPNLSIEFTGRHADAKEGFSALIKGFIIALIAIYLLLAIPFESYIKPIIIMIAIPFGIIGAYLGHIILGYQLSLISYMGIVALAGVVINDTLVMMDYANRQKALGKNPFEAIILAGTRRFRPIMLTTLTTFFGLAPMIFETSIQARFLIPMAISLGFGILFATFITLIIMPALYMILEDISRLISKPSLSL